MTATRETDRTEPAGRAGVPDRAESPERLRHAWTLVARREIATRLVDRTFLVGTVLTLALITGFVVVQAVLSSRVSTYDLVATPSATAMAQQVADRAPELDDSVSVTVTEVARRRGGPCRGERRGGRRLAHPR